ncbi:hypothetical protein ACWCYY_11085 [Kitasatospora sp. NPDC001664]
MTSPWPASSAVKIAPVPSLENPARASRVRLARSLAWAQALPVVVEPSQLGKRAKTISVEFSGSGESFLVSGVGGGRGRGGGR